MAPLNVWARQTSKGTHADFASILAGLRESCAGSQVFDTLSFNQPPRTQILILSPTFYRTRLADHYRVTTHYATSCTSKACPIRKCLLSSSRSRKSHSLQRTANLIARLSLPHRKVNSPRPQNRCNHISDFSYN